ncbi:protein artemis-like isoform X2 [Uranotaenia lowii]|uniref:protein artemis-like isoform X2 n=1 Tax=Uranotaenia lowii TaxID=190385 RepID=UPI00247A23AF|nr:protein artemis-like isoform X2 [Uranotaenia lowii]
MKRSIKEFAASIDPQISSKALWDKINRIAGNNKKQKTNNPIQEDVDMAEKFMDLHFGNNDIDFDIPLSYGRTCEYNILNAELWNSILCRKKNRSAPSNDQITYGNLSYQLKEIKVIAIPKHGKDQSSIEVCRIKKMSTFNGFIDSIGDISIDRFDLENRAKSQVFFLSHCHWDHMFGLQLPDALPGPLWTSAVSAVFLKHRFPVLVDCIRVLEIGESTEIEIDHGQRKIKFLVIALPTGHCPGAVMFLFTTEGNKTILYTGDFRISYKDLRNMIPLRNLTLETVYLDSTFLSEHYQYFPSQKESLNAILELVEEWLAKDSRNVISFKLPALYGCEYLFLEIARKLKEKIHVKFSELQQYRFLASLDDTVTADEKQTRIHACLGTKFGFKLPCLGEVEEKFIRLIRPSALRWRNLKIADPFWRKMSKKREDYSVCYSNHASFDELIDFLHYLKPKKVHFNVVPQNDSDGRNMKLLLNPRCPYLEDDENTSKLEQSPLKFDGIVYSEAATNNRVNSDDSCDEEGLKDPLPKRVRN